VSKKKVAVVGFPIFLAAALFAGGACNSTKAPSAHDGGLLSTKASPAVTTQDSLSSAASISKDKLTLIEGNCVGGREIGDLSNYSFRLRAKSNTLGFIRVRRQAIWDVEDTESVLGTVPCGTLLWGNGPLKNAEFSAGVGYAVPLRDAGGNQSRGYVSYTVVDVLSGPGVPTNSN